MSISNETILIGLLALGIGAAIATLAVLEYDVRAWKRRLQKTKDQRDEVHQAHQVTQNKLQNNEKKLVAAQKEIEGLSQRIEERDEQISKLDTEKNVLQSELKSANDEIDQLNERLNQVNDHVEELREETQKLESDLQTAAGQNLLMQENLERYNTQLEASRRENQEVCQKLAVAEVELTHLQKDLEETRALEERVELLQTEKDALTAHLLSAEDQIKDLKAQLDGSTQQIAETQMLRKRLVEVETDMKSATSQVEALQQKLTAVQGTLDYTGKGQLQIIRGIGPTYANRLKEAGIHTLNDLAKAKPEQVKDAIKLKSWQNVNPADWIQEAKALTVKLGEEGES